MSTDDQLTRLRRGYLSGDPELKDAYVVKLEQILGIRAGEEFPYDVMDLSRIFPELPVQYHEDEELRDAIIKAHTDACLVQVRQKRLETVSKNLGLSLSRIKSEIQRTEHSKGTYHELFYELFKGQFDLKDPVQRVMYRIGRNLIKHWIDDRGGSIKNHKLEVKLAELKSQYDEEMAVERENYESIVNRIHNIEDHYERLVDTLQVKIDHLEKENQSLKRSN